MPDPDFNPSPIRDYLAVVILTTIVMVIPLTPACSKRLDPMPPSLVEPVPEVWATDGDAPDAGPLAKPMPAKPFEGQKRPNPKTGKCDTDEVLMVGACWVEVVRPPRGDTCGPKFFHAEGKCYLPVKEAARVPSAIDP